MHKMRFHLHITPQQYQTYYQGVAKFVNVRTEDGRNLKFPASELQRYVTHNGIQGRFEIIFNEQHKLIDLIRLSS